MKKSILARGFIGSVASLLGVMAVGCAGTEGPGAEIGSTAQALTRVGNVQDLANAVAADGTTDVTNPLARYFSASCLVEVGGVESMIIAGGYRDDGSALADVYKYTPSDNKWRKMEDMPGTARGEAQLVKISDTECVLVGGFSNRSYGVGTGVAATYKFTADSSDGSWSANLGNLNAPRAKFGVSQCGTTSTRLIVYAGHGESESVITGVNAIEVFTSGTGWVAENTSSTVLTTPVHSFGYAVADDLKLFALSGGVSAGGAHDKLQTFTANDDCSTITQGPIGQLKASDESTNQARVAGIAFFIPGTDDVVVAAGQNASNAAITHAARFTVNLAGPSVALAASNSLITGGPSLRYPTLAPNGDFIAADKWTMIGGEQVGSGSFLNRTPVNTIAQLKIVSNVVSFETPTTLGSARLGSAAQFVDGDIYASAGLNVQGSPNDTLLTTTEEITP